jgi:hypothetical protein
VDRLQIAGESLVARHAAREAQLTLQIQQAAQHTPAVAPAPASSRIRPSDCPAFDGNGRNVNQYATDIAVFQTIHGTYFAGNEVAMVAWLAKGLQGNAAVWFRNHCLSVGYGTLENGALGVGVFPFPTLAVYLSKLREGHPGHAETELARQRLADFVDAQGRVRPEHKGARANLHYINGFRQLQLQLPGIAETEQKHYFRKGLAHLDPTLAGAIIREGTLEASLTAAMTKIEAGEIAIADHKWSVAESRAPAPRWSYDQEARPGPAQVATPGPDSGPAGAGAAEAMDVDPMELHAVQLQIDALQLRLSGLLRM